MRILFLLLVLANLGYLAWQLYQQPPAEVAQSGPITIDAHTPPLVLLQEFPSQPPPAESSLLPREPALQEFPPEEATAAATP